MSTTRVAVLSGRGKTGRAVAAALAARGAEPVPVGREGWDDLPRAVAGCAAAYVVAPNLHPDEPALVSRALDALRAAGVPRVAYHSVAWPHAPAMPHHLGKAAAEDLVRRSGLAWTVLQPCAYTQNLLPGLRQTGAVEVPYHLDAPFGLVDLADVGEAAAAVLLDDGRGGHRGATYELGGPALVTVRDVARLAGDVLGHPVEARRTPVPEGTHPWLRAMFASYDAHGLPAGGRVLAALLGRPATCVGDVLAREVGGARARR